MGNIKDFRNDFPTTQNTNAGGSPSMPVLANINDDTRASQPNAIVEALIEHEIQIGDDTIPVGSLRYRVAALEGAGVIPHLLGGASHTADTLANLNSKVSDATLDDVASPRDADAILDTGDPVRVPVGAVAESQFLRRLGTTIISEPLDHARETTQSMQYYVDGTAGNDGADGLSWVNARKTINGISEIIIPHIKHHSALNCRNTIISPSTPTIDVTLYDLNQFVIDGGDNYTIVDDNTGSNYTPTGATDFTLTVSGAGWSADTFVDSCGLVEIISTGELRTIQKNTSDTITVTYKFSSIPTGLAFRIVTYDTIIKDTGSYWPLKLYAKGLGQLHVQRMRFQERSYILAYGDPQASMYLAGIAFDMSAASSFSLAAYNLGDIFLYDRVRDPTSFSWISDRLSVTFPQITTPPQFNQCRRVSSYGAVYTPKPTFNSCVLRIWGYGSKFSAGCAFNQCETISDIDNDTNHPTVEFSNASGNGLDIIGGHILINDADIDFSNCSGHGIECTQNAQLKIDAAISGGTNTDHGVAVSAGGRVTTAAGITPTLTGTNGDVKENNTTKVWEPDQTYGTIYSDDDYFTIQNGFVYTDNTESLLAFDDGTRTFSITPVATDFTFWSGKKKYVKATQQSVVIPDVEDVYHFYFDSDGVLQYTVSLSDTILEENAYVANCYWDAVNNLAIDLTNERHGRKMSSATHIWGHHGIKTIFETGLALTGITADGDGSLDSHAQCGVSDGIIRDEDIKHTITNGSPQTLSPIAQIPIYYRLGAGGLWRVLTATNFPISTTGTGRAAYNLDTAGTWSVAEVANNDFTLSHLFATGNVNAPIIIVMGQGDYVTLNQAREGATVEINSLALGQLTGIFAEFRAIGTIIFKTATGMTNTVKSAIQSDGLGNDYVDFRFSGISPGVGSSTSNHDDLSNNGGVGSHATIQTFMDLLTTKGDIRVRNGSTEIRLGVGTNGQHLEADSTQASGLKWATPSGSASPLTTKGDLFGYDTADARIPIGTDGQVLTANSSKALGLEWATPAAGGGDTVKVSADDTTAGYLNGKLTAGTGITLTENNGGGNEDLEVSIDPATYVPGVEINMLSVEVGTTRSTTSTSYVGIGVPAISEPGEVIDEFVAPYEGDYVITVIGNWTGTANWGWIRVVFDYDTTPIYLGTDSKEWYTAFYSGDIRRYVFKGQVNLAAGTHKVKLEWKVDSGTIYQYINQGSAIIRGHLITGSGAGGTILDHNVKTADQSIASGSFVTITELSLSFDTSDDEEIEIGCQLFLRQVSATLHFRSVYYRVDSGSWVWLNAESVNYDVSFTSTVIVSFSAGSHTVDFAARMDNGTVNFMGGDTEIQSGWGVYPVCRSWARQYRGGLVPYYDRSSTLVQDKPTQIKAGVGIDFGDSNGEVTISSDNIAVTSELNIIDALNDNVFDTSIWTKDIPTVGTITEQNDRLEIAHTGGTSLDWYSSVNYNAPGVEITLEPLDFTAKVFVDNVTATNANHIALIMYLNGTDSSYHRFELFYDGAYKVRAINSGSVGTAYTIGQDNAWLCILRRGFRIHFLYSTAAKTAEPDVNDMTVLASHVTGLDQGFSIADNIFSIRSLSSAGYPAFTNYINNFSLLYESETAAKFNMPENIPILEYSSASVVNVISAPGADGRLIATLNNGAQYEATSPLTMNMSTSGLGGLEASASESSSTWYYLYLVPSTTAGGMDVVATDNDPDSGGPDDYTAWRYIGAVRNDASSNFLAFYQDDNFFQYFDCYSVGALTKDSAWHTITISTLVPQTCGTVYGHFYDAGDVGGHTFAIRPYGSSASLALFAMNRDGLVFKLITPGTTKRFDYKATAGGSASIRLSGWFDNHLSKNRTMPLFQIPPDSVSYKGHMEDTLPVVASAYSNEFNADSDQSDWSWDGGGVPNGTNESYNISNYDRLVIGFGGDGSATIQPHSDGAVYSRSAITSGTFTLWTKPYLFARASGNIMGLIIYSTSFADGVMFVIGQGDSSGSHRVRVNSRSGSGLWTNIINRVQHFNREPVLSLTYNTSSGAYSAGVHIDQNPDVKMNVTTQSNSFTPAKFGVFTEFNATGSGDIALGAFEWFRVTT